MIMVLTTMTEKENTMNIRDIVRKPAKALEKDAQSMSSPELYALSAALASAPTAIGAILDYRLALFVALLFHSS